MFEIFKDIEASADEFFTRLTDAGFMQEEEDDDVQ